MNRAKLEAMLKWSRKRLLQRKLKLIAKHAQETVGRSSPTKSRSSTR